MFLLEQLSEKNRTVSAPRFSPDGKYLIWLEKEVGGPHHAAMTIMRLELPVSDVKSRIFSLYPSV